tara:strand:- start:1988 stop:2251 length:264 start_codon:yes stop_codon:yes gene_type:complete
MNIPDYLHSPLLHNKKNDKVFQKTYDVINDLTDKITINDMRQAGLDATMRHDNGMKKLFQDLSSHNATIISDHIIEIVNYTIHNFEK